MFDLVKVYLHGKPLEIENWQLSELMKLGLVVEKERKWLANQFHFVDSLTVPKLNVILETMQFPRTANSYGKRYTNSGGAK